MDFDDLVTLRPPPPNRVGKHDGEHERHLSEGAVMVAYAMHLLRTTTTAEVRIHPDGEHGKRFDFAGWLVRRGFTLGTGLGTTSYGGTYTDAAGRTIIIQPKSGIGDLSAEIDGTPLMVECKGGVINTRHSGQVSRLYKGLCEAIGLLMAMPAGGRQMAVVPHTASTLRLATRLAPRCAAVGIEIALVGDRGQVTNIGFG